MSTKGYTLIRRRDEPENLYLMLSTGEGTAQYKLPNVETATQLGLDPTKFQEWYNTPLNYYAGVLTDPKQILSLYKNEKQIEIGGKFYNPQTMAEMPYNSQYDYESLSSGILNPFPTTGTAFSSNIPVEQPTAFQLAHYAGKAQGLTNEQIGQNWASQQKLITPNNMTNYTVQSGDTLSAIAQKYGVKVSDISGYKSGNPNMIYPGESLSIKSGTPKDTIPSEIIDGTGGSANWKIPDSAGFSPDMSSIAGILASQKSLLDNYLKNQQEIQKIQSNLQTTSQSWIDKIMGRKGAQEVQSEAMAGLGVDQQEYFTQRSADIAELNTLQQQYAQMEGDKQLALSAEQERLAPVSFIASRMSRVERDANIRLNTLASKINTKATIMDLQDKNFDRAYSIAQDAVRNYTYDTQQMVDNFKLFYDTNREIINDLNDSQKDIFNTTYTLLQNELGRQTDEYWKKFNAIIDLAKAGVDVSGIGSDLSKVSLDQLLKMTGNVSGGGIEETQIFTKLNASKGTDGYVDPNVYQNLKQTSKMGPDEFDKRYGNMLSPQERSNLGMASVIPVKELTSEQLSIVNDAKARLDAAKQMYEDTESVRNAIIEYSIQQFGFDPSPYF